MATKAQVEKLTKDLMKKHGLVKDGWTFRFSKGTNCFGQCRYGTFGKKQVYKQEISISEPLSKVNTLERVKMTVLHEIAHALTKGHGHDRVWQRKCIEIGGNGQAKWTEKDTIRVDRDKTKTIGRNVEFSDSYFYKGQTWKIGDRFHSTHGSKYEIVDVRVSNYRYPLICVEQGTGKKYKIAPYQIASRISEHGRQLPKKTKGSYKKYKK
jgi:uncharacterized protein (UPF0335 family)